MTRRRCCQPCRVHEDYFDCRDLLGGFYEVVRGQWSLAPSSPSSGTIVWRWTGRGWTRVSHTCDWQCQKHQSPRRRGTEVGEEVVTPCPTPNVLQTEDTNALLLLDTRVEPGFILGFTAPSQPGKWRIHFGLDDSGAGGYYVEWHVPLTGNGRAALFDSTGNELVGGTYFVDPPPSYQVLGIRLFADSEGKLRVVFRDRFGYQMGVQHGDLVLAGNRVALGGATVGGVPLRFDSVWIDRHWGDWRTKCGAIELCGPGWHHFQEDELPASLTIDVGQLYFEQVTPNLRCDCAGVSGLFELGSIYADSAWVVQWEYQFPFPPGYGGECIWNEGDFSEARYGVTRKFFAILGCGAPGARYVLSIGYEYHEIWNWPGLGEWATSGGRIFWQRQWDHRPTHADLAGPVPILEPLLSRYGQPLSWYTCVPTTPCLVSL